MRTQQDKRKERLSRDVELARAIIGSMLCGGRFAGGHLLA